MATKVATFEEIAERARELRDHEAPTHLVALINRVLELVEALAVTSSSRP